MQSVCCLHSPLVHPCVWEAVTDTVSLSAVGLWHSPNDQGQKENTQSAILKGQRSCDRVWDWCQLLLGVWGVVCGLWVTLVPFHALNEVCTWRVLDSWWWEDVTSGWGGVWWPAFTKFTSNPSVHAVAPNNFSLVQILVGRAGCCFCSSLCSTAAFFARNYNV